MLLPLILAFILICSILAAVWVIRNRDDSENIDNALREYMERVAEDTNAKMESQLFRNQIKVLNERVDTLTKKIEKVEEEQSKTITSW